jgi:transposase
MTRALSQDLRSRVIAAVDGGLSCNAAAARFGIAVSSAIRWIRAWRVEGRVTALPQGGDLRSHHIEVYRDVILGAIDADVDITLVELSELLHRKHEASFAPSTVWRFLDRHDLTFKKKQRTPASRSASTSPLAGRPGSTHSLTSIPRTWCSSTKPQCQRRWIGCGDERRADNDAEHRSRTAIGKQSRSSSLSRSVG